MTTGRSGADRRRRSAVDPAIGQIRGFYKLFSVWVFQALCSIVPLDVRETLGITPENHKPAWRWFLERIPKSREEASIGIASDLDAVLTKLSTGKSTEFHWLAPWAALFDTLPDARTLLAFAGLELAEAFRKIKEPCSASYLRAAIGQYHDDERSLLSDLTAAYPGAMALDRPSPALQVGRVLIDHWLHGASPSFRQGTFGPGAVAEKLDHIDRAVMLPAWRPVYRSSEREPVHFRSRDEWRTWMLTHDDCEAPGFFPQASASRMVAVPKTSTKPRLIAAEPAAKSWLQQSLMAVLKRQMSKFPYLNITDQSHNQRLCLRGLATIDQSRASDRVADVLVRYLFPEEWVSALERARTDSVECLCGLTHHLSKFAGMGSATTFPVETLVFAACAMSRAYLEMGGSPWDDRHSVLSWLENQEQADVWGFYGDDAVVPNELFDPLCDEYRRWGFIPNRDKSYSGSEQFRESCGVMAYQDTSGCWSEVSPARFSAWPSGSTKVAHSAATVEVLNQIRLKIFLLTGEVVDCDRSAWTKIPVRHMLWDYSNMKDLLWSPKGFGWWDGMLDPVSPQDLQEDWSLIGDRLRPGISYVTKCTPDGEIPPAALHVCLSTIRGPIEFRKIASRSKDGESVEVWDWVNIPTPPSVLREPRPYKVRAVELSELLRRKARRVEAALGHVSVS